MHLADALKATYIQAIHFWTVCVFHGNWTHKLLRCWRNALTTEPQQHEDIIKIYDGVMKMHCIPRCNHVFIAVFYISEGLNSK